MAAIVYPPTSNGLQKTLGAQLDEAVTASATLNNTTGIQNLKGLFVVDRIDTSGAEKEAALREYITFAGVSGSTVTTLVRGLGGTTDQDHAIGAVVEFVSDVVQQQAIIDTILVGHTGAGAHTSDLVTTLKASGANINTGTSDVTIVTPKAIADSAIPSATSTTTFTNKRITPRVVTATSYTTDTGTSLNCGTTDRFIVTAQAGDLKFNNPSGTPTDGQTLWVSVTGTGARALTYDTQFEASAAVALPTTTVTTARLDIGFIWRADTSKWHCVASA
jgi:hypothetical protein